jgi:pimeloyl-ACP methyl ester carboxylesterase
MGCFGIEMRLVRLALAPALALIVGACTALPSSNSTAPAGSKEQPSIHSDPSAKLQPPASMEELRIQSHGSRINGLMYRAAGPGPHPLVIFLHGTPGNERNLDLAQAVRRAGYQALYFDYRGDFGSGGSYSLTHGLEDTAAVLAWVRMPENIAKYQVDSTRIALVGHSDGGFFALMSVGNEPAGVCVAALAASNNGWDGSRFAEHPDERAAVLNDIGSLADTAGGPLHTSADEFTKDLGDHASEWDYLSQANALKDRALLLVAATRDTPDEGVEMNARLVEAIRRAGGKHVQVVNLDDDHPFSSHRVALADTLVHWLRTDCARIQAAGERPR